MTGWLDGTGLLGTPTPVGTHFHALWVRIPGGSAHRDERCFLVPVTYGVTPHKKGVSALTFGVWILLGTQAVPLAKLGAGQGPGVKKMSKTMVQPQTWWSSLASVFRSSNPAGWRSKVQLKHDSAEGNVLTAPGRKGGRWQSEGRAEAGGVSTAERVLT